MITILNGAQGALHYKNNVPYWGALGVPPKDYTEPFYMENKSGKSVKMRIWGTSQSSSYAPSITIEYSTDLITWNTLGTTHAGQNLEFTLPSSGKFYMRANAAKWASVDPVNQTFGENNFRAHDTGTSIKIGGNIMSLIYGDNFTGMERSFPANTIGNFAGLFSYQYEERYTLDIRDLILPATTLTNYCYSSMFAGQRDMLSVPELPAIELAPHCYSSMFSGCRSITSAPILPATTIPLYGYYHMFYNCYNLSYVKCLATNKTYPTQATNDWLKSVADSGTFYKKAGVSWPTGADGIPSGWTVVEV